LGVRDIVRVRIRVRVRVRVRVNMFIIDRQKDR
jgi:hypothetical protein